MYTYAYIYIYVYIPSHLSLPGPSLRPPIPHFWVVAECKAGPGPLCHLHGGFPLASYFTHESVYMSMLLSPFPAFNTFLKVRCRLKGFDLWSEEGKALSVHGGPCSKEAADLPRDSPGGASVETADKGAGWTGTEPWDWWAVLWNAWSPPFCSLTPYSSPGPSGIQSLVPLPLPNQTA